MNILVCVLAAVLAGCTPAREEETPATPASPTDATGGPAARGETARAGSPSASLRAGSRDGLARIAGDEFLVGAPVRFRNLTVFPLRARTPRPDADYLTLDEGLKAGTVVIAEMGADVAAIAAGTTGTAEATGGPTAVAAPQAENAAGQSDGPAVRAAPNARAGSPSASLRAGSRDGPAANAPAAQNAVQTAQVQQSVLVQTQEGGEVSGEVNRLCLVNNSGKPLFLMAGEIVVGGKQDRTISRDTLIAPDGAPVPIDVFCVEHGRWTGRDAARMVEIAQGAGAVDPDVPEPTLSMAPGQFAFSAGALSKGARLKAQESEDQGAVWEAVGQTNAGNQAQWGSGAFTANYTEETVRERFEPYCEALAAAFAQAEGVIGVVVAVDDRIESADVFAGPALFAKLWPKLLKSYALDAAGSEHREREFTVAAEKAHEFLDEVTKLEPAESEEDGRLRRTKAGTDKLAAFNQWTPAPAGGDEGLLHGNWYTK